MSQTQLTHPQVTDREPGQCPSWCRADHAKHDLHSRYTWGDGPDEIAWRSSHHSVDVAVIDNPGAGPPVYVSVKATDDLPDPDGIPTIEEPNAGPTTIDLDGAECMTANTATEVAAAITKAVRVATGGEQSGDGHACGNHTPAACMVARYEQELRRLRDRFSDDGVTPA